MLRTALKPKWLALFALVVLVAIAFVQLGRWQLGVAHDNARADALEEAGRQPVVPVATLLTPHTEFPAGASGRLVTVTGTYAEGQVVVPGRLLTGREGYWVLTPLREQGSGALLPLVRGWTPNPTAPPPPAGQLTVAASLAPGESPVEGTPPAGQLGSVDLARLVNVWPGELYNGFGFVQHENPGPTATPDAPDDPGALERVPPPRPDTGVKGRNAAYALQWWIFAGFAFFLWIKMVQQESRQRRAETRTLPPAPAPTMNAQEP